MNSISSWAIRNPVATLILFLVLTLSGLVGFSKLRLNSMPDMDIPTVTVSVPFDKAAVVKKRRTSSGWRSKMFARSRSCPRFILPFLL